MYLQERISGPAGSVIFASAGKDAVVLGLSRQLVGETLLGARGFRYCGNLLAGSEPLFSRQAELLDRAADLAAALTREFDLRGLNGIDFIARAGVPYPIEVNPRFSGSMELLERGCGMSMFEVHAAACRGRLPTPSAPTGVVQGKAIVFARRALRISNSSFWHLHQDLADLPHPGERIQRDRPICTVFAEARTGESCRARLLRRAALVYRATGQPLRRAS
jgi:predicted ATP-grasp superfamily ATP-dependent carboligase